MKILNVSQEIFVGVAPIIQEVHDLPGVGEATSINIMEILIPEPYFYPLDATPLCSGGAHEYGHVHQ